MKKILYLALLALLQITHHSCVTNTGGEKIPMSDKPKIMWFDATANFERFSYRDSIVYYLEKTKNAGFTHVVVCARPVSGEALYKSKILDELTEWRGFVRDVDWDYLDVFIKESHKLGLTVYASVNTFSGGHSFVQKGIVFQDEVFSGYTTLLNTPNGLKDIKELDNKYSVFFNPVFPEVQSYVLSILGELVANYDLDGIILDRARFDTSGSDFTDYSRSAFENYIGHKVENFPNDIFSWVRVEASMEKVNGKLYEKWIEWRAKVIYDFFKDARELVKSINPNMEFGTYTGAWYPTYFNEGVNWASQKFDASSEFSWATPEFSNYGYAALLDVYMTGVYYNQVQGSGWYTVEGGLNNVKRVMMGDVPVAGGLYVDIYKDEPQAFAQAVKACLVHSDGLMVFDIVHLINYGFWDALKQGINDAIEFDLR